MHICIHAYIKCARVFPRGLQICKWFNFSILGQGVQAAHPVLHQQRHWMKAGDIWPDQSDAPAIMPFRLWILWFTHSGDRTQLEIFKHVWVQWPITSTFTNRERDIYIYIWASWTDILSYKCVEATPVPKGYKQPYSGVQVLTIHWQGWQSRWMAVASEAPCSRLGYGIWSTPRTCSFCHFIPWTTVFTQRVQNRIRYSSFFE